ncbi:XdhC/CoxI family protein [Pelotomaculum propionicicum]|uniref:Putative xanthine dehydrogenase subunit A n=1 Tax=Pelotomaculum propionicicum TaxID=258475 RepID=A0A4Y7RVJ9_9FIRM|nr:XdhC/CoxI family protein [Pelotomaculum propionicicum]NLI12057.1 xanthine dehydrogenase [Peptococcaceae bacterium]TEB13015.1 putative xanthine dehydrogenase subunit A [Pelotomaculum propionicicum]
MGIFNLRREIVVVTVISHTSLPSNLVGRKKAFTLREEAGDLRPPWLENQVASHARQVLDGGMFKVVSLHNPFKPEEKATVMIEPYLPPCDLIILGGGHIALPLASVGRLLGYHVTVVDDRPEFIAAERVPSADRGVFCSFDHIEEHIDFGPGSSVVIVTRGHLHDLDCLRKVLKHNVAYIGMIGSRRKVNMAKEELLAQGFDRRLIDSVHMPVGLDIGAQTPEEIAVSIGAELIKVRRGGSALSLKEGCTTGEKRLDTGEMPKAADLDILQKAVKAACDNVPAAMATIVRTKGSTPRKAGARMLVYGDGRICGTIGGGSGEFEIRMQALNVINDFVPVLHVIAMDAEKAAGEGMICGGSMEVFIEPVRALAGIFH